MVAFSFFVVAALISPRRHDQQAANWKQTRRWQNRSHSEMPQCHFVMWLPSSITILGLAASISLAKYSDVISGLSSTAVHCPDIPPRLTRRERNQVPPSFRGTTLRDVLSICLHWNQTHRFNPSISHLGNCMLKLLSPHDSCLAKLDYCICTNMTFFCHPTNANSIF